MTTLGVIAMWDTVQPSTTPLSHDLPCGHCGHAPHTFLACSDDCDCAPAPAHAPTRELAST